MNQGLEVSQNDILLNFHPVTVALLVFPLRDLQPKKALYFSSSLQKRWQAVNSPQWLGVIQSGCLMSFPFPPGMTCDVLIFHLWASNLCV